MEESYREGIEKSTIRLDVTALTASMSPPSVRRPVNDPKSTSST
jgi:hypothetical protein